MPKRKKHPKLPSGWGSIRYLGKGRRNPYAVHPPCTGVDDKGNYIRPKPICYVDDWYVGFAVLNANRAGTYKPGDELLLSESLASGKTDDTKELDGIVRRILSDYEQWHATDEKKEETEEEKRKKMTFSEVYREFYEWKFGENAPKKLSDSRRRTVKNAYDNMASLHSRIFRELRVDDLQAVINACPLAKGSLEKMKGLLAEMYKYADARDLCERDYSKHVIIPSGAKEDEHGVPFSLEDIKRIWEDRDDPTSELLTIMIYSGFRIAAYKTIEVDLEEGYFRGGLKTQAGKERIVPIHPCINDLVRKRLERDKSILACTVETYRKHLKSRLDHLGISEHTPHDARHTFSALCEKYEVSEADRKRMLGHSFGSDITNGIYGHRTLQELAEQMAKIPAPPDM